MRKTSQATEIGSDLSEFYTIGAGKRIGNEGPPIGRLSRPDLAVRRATERDLAKLVRRCVLFEFSPHYTAQSLSGKFQQLEIAHLGTQRPITPRYVRCRQSASDDEADAD